MIYFLNFIFIIARVCCIVCSWNVVADSVSVDEYGQQTTSTSCDYAVEMRITYVIFKSKLPESLFASCAVTAVLFTFV